MPTFLMPTFTRIAPTPSGFLHIGNAWSFVLTWLIARSQGFKIYLRIDDLDTARFRPEYLEDIFQSLKWLGIDWDSGPLNAEEFMGRYRQGYRHDQYLKALEMLCQGFLNSDLLKPDLLTTGHERASLVYACNCSREKIKNASTRPGIYPQTCLKKNLPLLPAKRGSLGKGLFSENSSNAIRIHIAENDFVQFDDEKKFPAELIGDFIIWQKNGEAAYQLASLVDDEILQMNFIVRGRDLIPSTCGQLFLAKKLGYKKFIEAQFFHHGLILNSDGSKLSKSSSNGYNALLQDQNLFPMTLKYWREGNGLKGRTGLLSFFAQCLRLGGTGSDNSSVGLGLGNTGSDKPSMDLTVESLPELLSAFQNRYMPSGNLDLTAIPTQDFSADFLFDNKNA